MDGQWIHRYTEYCNTSGLLHPDSPAVDPVPQNPYLAFSASKPVRMFDRLQAYFEKKVPLTAEQLQIMESLFICKRMQKGEFLQRAGEVAQYAAFVAVGCLRSYTIDAKGKEHIIEFAPENWWLSDAHSMRTSTPSLYFMDALEPTDVLLIEGPSYEKMLQLIPGIARSYQVDLQTQAAVRNRRIASSLSATARERYLDFLNTYPSLALRIPQHMIASYLGLTPETVSRVRRQLSRNK